MCIETGKGVKVCIRPGMNTGVHRCEVVMQMCVKIKEHGTDVCTAERCRLDWATKQNLP